MCGIAGIVDLSGPPVAAASLAAMCRALAHRGPDGEDFWLDGGVGFGHRRLAIRDLSDAGRQPMVSRDGRYVLVCNGEIYNDRPLKRRLERERGAVFRSDCDSEVIPELIAADGTAGLAALEGMYAFALWDAHEKRLLLARDPIGIKPLYYRVAGGRLAFASEVKALLAAEDAPVALDPRSVRTLLAQGYPDPERSLVEGIRAVPPGSFLLFDAEGVRIERHWQPARTAEIDDIDEALAALRPLLEEVVEAMLISDVPVGMLLSGGIDSALVAAALKDRASLPAFTAGFGTADFDETPLARQVAAATGHRHVPVGVAIDEEIEEHFLEVARIADGQLGDSSALAFMLVCREARRHVPVVLSGDGADEFFGGYETYRATRLAAPLAGLVPATAAGGLASLMFRMAARSEKRLPPCAKAARLLDGLAVGGDFPHPQWRRYLRAAQEPDLLGPAVAPLAEEDALAAYAESGLRGGSLVDRCLLADQSYYLPGDMLMKVDLMSMASAVEVRVPFLDRRLMSFAGRLHARLLTPMRGPDKLVLRRLLGQYGIGGDIARLPKRGFNVPVAAALRSGLRRLGDRLLDADADVLAPYLRPDGVRRLWREHRDRSANNGYALWTMLTMAAWRAGPA